MGLENPEEHRSEFLEVLWCQCQKPKRPNSTLDLWTQFTTHRLCIHPAWIKWLSFIQAWKAERNFNISLYNFTLKSLQQHKNTTKS